MRIKGFVALLCAFLLALPCAVLAEGCALCGAECGTDSYLCTACLLELLEEDDLSGELVVDAPVVNPDGTVTISWTDGADKGPYTVRYELLESAPVPFGWTAASDVADTSFTLSQLAPGVSYVITVVNAQGDEEQCVYYAPVPGTDTQIGARIRFKTMRRQEAARRTVRRDFSASEIMANTDYEYGLYLRLTYSMLIRTRNYAFCITVEAPNGFTDVILSGNLELLYGKSAVPVWGFIPVDNYFACLKDYYGGIPTGEYKVTMHFNGNRVYTETFDVVD